MPTKPRLVKRHRYKPGLRIRLTQRTRDELLATAGLDPGDRSATKLIKAVEESLSDVVQLRENVDTGPTEAARAVLLLDVATAARALERALSELDQRSLMEFDSPFVDPNTEDAIVDDLVDLYETAEELRGDALKASRRGRATEDTRDYAIRLLAGDFHKLADPLINGEYRAALLEFLGIALRATKFSAPGLGPRGAPASKNDLTEGRKTWQRVPQEFRTPR